MMILHGEINTAIHSSLEDLRNIYDMTAQWLEEYPDFEEEIDKIVAENQDKLDELTAWETAIDAQITTNSTELTEINAYLQQYKQYMTSNIQEDFNFGLS